jgi:fatty acid desaturase
VNKRDPSTPRPPFPVGFVAFAGLIGVGRAISSGGDWISALLVFLGAFAFFGVIYLVRVRR